MHAQDFDGLQPNELAAHVSARRNKIFLLMEEVRRLRIQQRLKVGQLFTAARLRRRCGAAHPVHISGHAPVAGRTLARVRRRRAQGAAACGLRDAAAPRSAWPCLRCQGAEVSAEQELEQETYLSALPFLPPLSEKTLNTYYAAYGFFFAGIIAFGGLVAPILEVKLGLGGARHGAAARRMMLDPCAAAQPLRWRARAPCSCAATAHALCSTTAARTLHAGGV